MPMVTCVARIHPVVVFLIFISWTRSGPSLTATSVASAFDGAQQNTCPTALTSVDRCGNDGSRMQTITTAGTMTPSWGKVEKMSAAATVSFDIYRILMKDDGTFPNNSHYPALLYKSAFGGTQAEGVRAITSGGLWTSPWVWG